MSTVCHATLVVTEDKEDDTVHVVKKTTKTKRKKVGTKPNAREDGSAINPSRSAQGKGIYSTITSSTLTGTSTVSTISTMSS